MKHFKTSLFVILLLLPTIRFTTCNQTIPKEKITVINDFVLGQPFSTFSKQLDSLSVPHDRFFTHLAFFSIDDLMSDKYVFSSHYSNTFNIGRDNTEHIGFFWPTVLPGTQNVIGMHILLAHTTQPALLNDLERYR